MEKRISYSAFQSVQSMAKACNPMVIEREKKLVLIKKLQKEYNDIDDKIKMLETGIISNIGFRTEELVKKVVETTTTQSGRTVKNTKYVPTDIVSYDENTKEYVITIPDEETPAEKEAENSPEIETPEHNEPWF